MANGSLLMATMEADPIPSVWDHNQDNATSFIRLNARRLKAAAKVQELKRNSQHP
jgi:hypothetical protein